MESIPFDGWNDLEMPTPDSYFVGGESHVHSLHIKIGKKKLSDYISLIATAVDEVNLYVDADGLHAKVVDPSHVYMVVANLYKGACEEYALEGEGHVGFDLDKLAEIMKGGKKDDVVSIDLVPELNKAKVEVNGMTRTMILVDTTGMTEPKVPKMDLPFNAIVDTKRLYDCAKQCEAVSDHIALIGSPVGLECESVGDTDSFKAMISQTGVSLDASNAVKSYFPLDTTLTLTKAMKCFKIGNMAIGSDYPFCYEAETDDMSAMCLLAPRIEND